MTHFQLKFVSAVLSALVLLELRGLNHVQRGVTYHGSQLHKLVKFCSLQGTDPVISSGLDRIKEVYHMVDDNISFQE